ncbi:MAG: hypothetical protein FJ311_13295 [Rhodospirillales bacterium]|nr:hypothetical protein [Rhodospirillales bacterium]
MNPDDRIIFHPVSLAGEELVVCAKKLAAAESKPIQLLFAAKAAHAALQAALVAALSGPDYRGAYSDKTAKRHEETVAPSVEFDIKDYKVVNFLELIEKAKTKSLLKLTEEENKLLERLSGIRDEIEHPKPVAINAFMFVF